MTRKELAELAFEECSNPETTTRYGVKRGNAFWNIESTQFMYVPAFHFTALRDCGRYLYNAVDENGTVHEFESNDSCALLSPIWRDIPEGMVNLTVTALDDNGKEIAIIGARRFFKLASFPEKTPERKCSYKEAAIKGYKYTMKQSFMQSWLKDGVPDPYYELNIYPTKMISSIVKSMLAYAKICPEDAPDAMKVAVNAADYLIKITPRGNVPLRDLPPTYNIDFCPDPEKYGIATGNFNICMSRMGTMMMIYPSFAGDIYLDLEEATGDKKYLDEAIKIGNYYAETVLPNGSWYLVRSTETGEPTDENYIAPLERVVPFLLHLYKRTGSQIYKDLVDGAVKYTEDTQLSTYNWEGQFEDSALSTNYHNLTHYGPVVLAEYYAENKSDDPKYLELAKELMRFAEDQFVIWKRPATGKIHGFDTSTWHTPCALEQYNWYVPIDASTSYVLRGFLALYKAGCGELYLAKAKALCDQLTIVQHDDGQIPTHWLDVPRVEGSLWINCMFESCETLIEMAPYEEK